MRGETKRLAAPLFAIPPFPHARHRPLMQLDHTHLADLTDDAIDDLIDLTSSARVGGSYWGQQPSLPRTPYTLICSADADALSKRVRLIPSERPVVAWLQRRQLSMSRPPDHCTLVQGTCDPWHLVGGAERIHCDADDDLALIASMAGVPVDCFGKGRFQMLDEGKSGRSALRKTFLAEVLQPYRFVSPFSGDPIDPCKAIELCAFWRAMIDSNRGIGSAMGFAPWKRPTVAPLLWAGSAPVPFNSRPQGREALAIWRSRVSAHELKALLCRENPLVEVEDGFIRSVGLGADCVPPLSIVVDHLGIYFDPAQESDLEHILNEGRFPADLLARARDIRELIVSKGVSKYGLAASFPSHGDRLVPNSILVPGQVEDDRSVLLGGGEVQSNLELLRRVRAAASGAHIIYKPHPDVETGHRIGRIPDEICLELADEIVRDQPISALFDRVEEVHVNTSLAGFEALLRGKPVTTYGVPFYAGWGLTRDLGQIPSRRAARRTLDELVAASLLIYPRYVDPLTGLPCPPEVLIDRLTQGSSAPANGLLVLLRRLQGRLKRRMGFLREKLA